MPRENSVIKVMELTAIVLLGMGLSKTVLGCVVLTDDQGTSAISPGVTCVPGFKGEEIEAAHNVSAQARANLSVYRLRYDAKLKRYACENMAGHPGYNKIDVKNLIAHPESGECANLERADLSGVDLRTVNLRGADLNGANLRRSDLRGVDLQAAKLRIANLGFCDLQGADLRMADMIGVDLHGANLGGANLHAANLILSNLTQANLTGADIRGADLRGADRSGANMTGVKK